MGVVALRVALGIGLPRFKVSVGNNIVIPQNITRDKGARQLAMLTVFADMAALSADAVDLQAGT
jgi:hypothetical protein